MTERDPALTLRMGDGEKLELTPHNTVLYSFLGRTAIGDMQIDNEIVNHAFVQTGRNEKNQPQGLYFFERLHPVYHEIAKFAIEHSFPMVLNQRSVPACDLQAYLNQVELEEARFHNQLEGVRPEDF